MPLTGEVLEDGQRRPTGRRWSSRSTTVPPAWPQSGLNAADIVFEEIIDDATRFAVVFHSQDAGPVGPVRSGRTQDVDLLGMLIRPLFAWSGGNPTSPSRSPTPTSSTSTGRRTTICTGATAAVAPARTTCSRRPRSCSPQTTPEAGRPTTIFEYLGPDETFDGEPAAGLEVKLDSMTARWEYSPETREYLRLLERHPPRDQRPWPVHHQQRRRAADGVRAESGRRPQPRRGDGRQGTGMGVQQRQVRRRHLGAQGTHRRFHVDHRSAARTPAPLELPPGRTVVEMTRNVPDGVPVPIPVPEPQCPPRARAELPPLPNCSENVHSGRRLPDRGTNPQVGRRTHGR